MGTQRLISRFRSNFIPAITFFASLLFLICIGPGVNQGLAAQVTLAWDANADPAVAGYKLYYGTASRIYGTPVDVGKVTQYTLTGIQEGANAYFAVTAYDASRNESAFSTELACFTLVPAPGVNGSISPSITAVVARGMNQTFAITPASGFAVADVLVNGVSVGAVSSYALSNISANYSITARFTTIQTPTKAITLWRNTVTGEVVICYMTGENGTTLSSYTNLPTVADQNWKIVGTADFNGDGKPDILWRNTQTGDNVVWYMTGEKGSTYSSYAYLPTVADQSWTMVGSN